MRIIGLAHTYYMMMVLIQLRKTIHKNDEFDLIFTNVTKGAEKTINRLGKTNIFNHCYYLDSGKCYIPYSAKKISKFIRVVENVIHPREAVESGGVFIDDYYYDKMYGYVINRHDEQCIFQLIKQINPYAVYSTYEESFVSYCSINGIFSSKGFIRSDLWLSTLMKVCGKSRYLISNNLDSEWFFDTSLVQYNRRKEFKKIPKFDINNNELTKQINYIFDINRDDIFNQKYVFLEDSAYLAGKKTDDLELLEMISNIVGKDNILVKLHPRTKEDRFKKNGFNTMKNNAPLEAIVLNVHDINTVFITMGSSAPLTCIVDFNSSNKSVMLFKCSKYPLDVVKDNKFDRYLSAVQKKYGSNGLFIPQNTTELCEYFRRG